MTTDLDTKTQKKRRVEESKIDAIEAIEAIDILIDGESVIIRFINGIEAIFEPYRHGFGFQIEGLRMFILQNKNGEILCKVNSRLYYAGPQEDEHKIVSMAKGWSQKKVAEYWGVARQFISSKFYPKGRDNYDIKDETYWYHERVVHEGYFDLERLKKAEMKYL